MAYSKIILCSSSPSRALLLKKFGIEFIQKSTHYDEEQIKTTIAKDFVYIASRGKLQSAIEAFGLETPLLCADTVIVSSTGEILRKPKNVEDARRILSIQSGESISIISSLHYKTKVLEFSNISTTDYTFASFKEEKLEKYLESGLWEGKAGGCMVEGFCKEYILKVEGLQSNAMGLQVEKLLAWLTLSKK